MPNPYITKKTENKLTITENAKKLFRSLYLEKNKSGKIDDSISYIKVSSLISRMAFYYEKIRNSVEYKEEYLLRKNAIERILNRLIVIEGSISLSGIKSHEVSANLLVELIRAGYLENNRIPETKIDELNVIIEKYLNLKRLILESPTIDAGEKTLIIKWTFAIMASEIEERLGRSKVDQAIADFMYDILNKKIFLPEGSPYTTDKEIQIYVGIHHSFFKYDRDMLAYILLKYYNAGWQNASVETVTTVSRNIVNLRNIINSQLDHPIAAQLNRIVSRYTVVFSILRDVLSEDPVGIYESFQKDPKAFPRLVKAACQNRYNLTRKKLWRAAVRSIIYIFLTKSILAIILEVPATKWFGEEINLFSLVINITFPALLLFIAILFTRLPSESNTKKIVDDIDSLVFVEKEKNDQYKLRPPAKRGFVLNIVFGILYAITFFMSFGFVIWILDKIQFSWVSIIIFLFFLAFVSFFNIRIRKNARELTVIDPKENIFIFIIDFFSVPIISTGKWLSEKFAKINIFVFILDFIIEAPFKIFVETAEEWTKYVKERKDEIG